jgi:quercetin dioxygenase-like cupin family protein
MYFSTMACSAGVVLVALSLCGACGSADSGVAAKPQAPSAGATASEVARAPLILAAGEGERRIRRVMGGALAIIKVDRRNGGSPDLMMGYEELPPGQAIQPHRHPAMDEIVFVHRGTGTAELGDRTAAVGPGVTVFIPQGTRVMLRNTGTEPLAVAYFFSQPGYEEYLRDTSVPDGQPAPPLSGSELAMIRERHKRHIVFDP